MLNYWSKKILSSNCTGCDIFTVCETHWFLNILIPILFLNNAINGIQYYITYSWEFTRIIRSLQDIIRVRCRSKSASKDRSCSRDRQKTPQKVHNETNCPCLQIDAAKERPSSVKSNLVNQKGLNNLYHYRTKQPTKEINYDKRQGNDSNLEICPCRTSRSRYTVLIEKFSVQQITLFGREVSTRFFLQQAARILVCLLIYGFSKLLF